MAGNEKVDVLIIGSGASGAAVAWSLADTRMRILCLEQGDWLKSTDFPSNGRDWEARRYTDFDISPNRRGRDTDYPVNDDSSPMKIANFNGVGGGTLIYTAHWPRMHPSDFKVKSLDGVADDWPVDYWALERFYDENDRMMGVSGLAGDPGVPPRNPPMPPIPLGRTGTHYARAMNRLGWHWWPSDTTIATTAYDGRAACINLGHCTPGCAQGAKASTDITYWPLAIRAGVELRTRCRVREITTNEHGMAAGAVYYDAEGREHFQPAEVVIVACNGVGTPRLLLNSASARFPKGLANSSGLVGKYIMDTVGARLYGHIPALENCPPHNEDGAGGGHFYAPWWLYKEQHAGKLDFARGYHIETGGTRDMPGGDNPVPEDLSRGSYGTKFKEDARRYYGSFVYFAARGEMIPNEHCYMDLDPKVKDKWGIPVARFHWKWSEHELNQAVHAKKTFKALIEAMGGTVRDSTDFRPEKSIQNPGYIIHEVGGAIIGDDPAKSVCNQWNQAWDVKNLFLCDGAPFASNADKNPTLTIMALAWRACDYLIDQAKKGNL